MLESFGSGFERELSPDVGFQPEVTPEGVSEQELADFFIAHLSMERPGEVDADYFAREQAYYRSEAERVLAEMVDEVARQQLADFLDRGV